MTHFAKLLNFRKESLLLLLSWSCFSIATQPVDAQVVISEFMASNGRTLADGDGDYSDWIELFNPGSSTANLEGWSLTDTRTNMVKWRFPSVNLDPNHYMVVFASGKNRAVAGSELHTSFKISTTGEYLALVKLDGASVAFAYTPQPPVQITDVSYGIPTQQTVTRLISVGAPGKLLVPNNDALATGWTDPDWIDADWLSVTTGIGYDVGGKPMAPVQIGDSAAEFSGVQGQDNWFYGYYNKTSDKTSGYQPEDFTPFPNGIGSHSAANYWNGNSWKWFNGDPPWTEIGQTYIRPNGINSGAEHWAIRRWISPVSGAITIQWHLVKQESGGNGVTARVLQNGFQKDFAVIGGKDVIGVTKTNTIVDVLAGDRIDFALAPAGQASSTDDTADGSFLSATIYTVTNLTSQVRTSVEAPMRNANASAYLRIPFVVTDPSQFQFLTLRMKYNDGFVAYLNGLEVARRNAPDEPVWNSSAIIARDTASSARFEEIDLSARIGLLHIGTNLLALHGLNASVTDSDFLLSPELSATQLTIDPTSKRYFSFPTPGAPNGSGNTKLGPLVVGVTHTPNQPLDDQDLTVTARAVPTFNPVRKLTLTYRVMFGAEVAVPMLDDGLHGDGAAGDQIYGAIIPASASSPGQMVRYFIAAEDVNGEVSRSPPYPDPKNSPQYFGTMIADPSVSSALPVFYWFAQTPRSAETDIGTRTSVFYQGAFYDNVGADLHGQSSREFPKKSYDISFNRGYHFRYALDQTSVEGFNLLTTYPDKTQMRNLLAYETYRDAGSTFHIAFPVRVQQNGAFYSVAHFVEDGNEDYLARLGLDPRGVLYKMYNTLDSSTANVEKKTRKYEKNTDLQALISGSRKSGIALAQYLYDNVNIPAMVDYLAAMIISGGVDCCHKNYYAYRDTEGNGEWQYLPWDLDLTFGRNWNSANTYYDDTMFAQNGLYVGNNNTLIAALFNNAPFKAMYLRRLRSLMDDMLQWTNTPPENFKYERRINDLATLLTPDAALDFSKWPTWGQKQTLAQAVNILTNKYFPARRNYLFRLNEIPKTPPSDALPTFGALDYNPASGNQNEEFIQLTNSTAFALDVSGWRLAGGVTHIFKPGTVLPARGSIYLSPNVVAFRARKTPPTGGQGLFIQGNYKGQLSARGETLRILDPSGREAATISYPGNPSPAQQFLRIIEMMYHPAPPPAGSEFQEEDFEFIQLKNIGAANLDLTGVRFTDGITFDFRQSSVTLLGPGESVYLAKNLAAFASRYGRGFNVAGPYSGNLDNRGEKIRLDDAAGENILDFSYDNSWYPATDGGGYSLVIADEKAVWNTWGEKLSWRAGELAGGSPATGSPALNSWRAAHFTAKELANPSVSGDDADPDLDGKTNIEEFLSGTDPRARESYLKIETAQLILAASPTVKIRFNAAAGKSYSVQFSDSLQKPNWTKLSDVPSQSLPQAVEVTDPIRSNQQTRYYRVVTPRQP